jgi:DNA-3-methyladenine glycosylase II
MHKFRKAFDFLRKDKIMKSLIDKVGNEIRIDDRSEKDLALAIALLVIEQQVSFKAAITIKKRFRNIIENKNYENIIKMEEEKMKSIGISYRKVEYIKNVYRYFQESKFDFYNESEEKVVSELIKIKGIGKWTAEMFLIFILFKENIFSKGDLALINSIKRNYRIDDLNEKKLDQIIENWSPYKTIASLLLWKSIEEMKFA